MSGGSIRAGKRVWLRVALALVGAVLLPELLLRFALFSDVAWVERWAAPLRRAELYAAPGSRANRALEARFQPLPESFMKLLDPRFGYLSQSIDPETLRHADEDELRGRRPILLFGDSFAQCTTRPEACFQGLTETSSLAERYALLNYGVGGYGFDQTCLLAERTVDAYADLDPIVVVSLLIDDDLDRCSLHVREYPKPRFELRGAELVLYPPPATTADRIVQATTGIRSYLWSLLARGADLAPAADPWIGVPGPEAMSALGERLVERVHARLEALGLAHFVLLFHGRSSVVTTGPFTWRESGLYAAFQRLGVPFVSSKRYLWEDARRTGRALDSYYISPTSKHGKNHYNRDGNTAAFEALRAGVEGRFEPNEYLAGATPPDELQAR